MKKILALVALILLVAGTASADQISFVWNSSGDTIQGVDGNTGWWSNNSSTKKLWTNQLNLLGGTASVKGYSGNCYGMLTQTGARGLGIWGRENDEIDSKWGCFFPERIEITFNNIPYWLNSLEIRSLFYEPNLWKCGTGKEEGQVDFYLSGNKVGGQHLVGWEDISTPGTNGVNYFTYDSPLVVDKLVFYVPTGRSYTTESEFAVAKLGVTAVPEPVSTILFLTGGAVMAVRRLRRR